MLTTKGVKTIQENMNLRYKIYITIRHRNGTNEFYTMV